MRVSPFLTRVISAYSFAPGVFATKCSSLFAPDTLALVVGSHNSVQLRYPLMSISLCLQFFTSSSDRLENVHSRGFKLANLTRRFAVALALLSGSTWAQQLSGAQIYMGYPGLSASCEQVLNTSVSCPIFLSPLSAKSVTPGSCLHLCALL